MDEHWLPRALETKGEGAAGPEKFSADKRMKKSFRILILLIGFTITFADLASAKDVKFEISLDRNRIAIGESTQLGLSFYGTQSMPAPDIGNIPGLEIRYIGPSTMMTVINGRVSSSITHMYTILPLKIGKFQLGPFSFNYKGDGYSSNIVFLEVAEEKIAAKGIEERPISEKLNLEDRIFLTLDVGKTTTYVNELVPVTVKLYVNRLNVSDIQLPTFGQEGFSKVEFKEPKQYRENEGGVVYDVLEFKTHIFGTRPGDYKLGPAKIKCNVMVKKHLARGPSAMDEFGEDYYRDSFFEDFFTRYERYPIELKSQESQIIISPLPNDGRPKDFLGSVGDYQFIFNATPTKLKVGDPITVRMDINGKGNFNTVLMPHLENTTGFKVYEPQVKTQENSKTFTQVLIPETDSVTQIPKASFNYFDPNKKEYVNITQGPIAIQVEKSKEEAPSQVIGPSVAAFPSLVQEELTRDILYIKESPGKWLTKGHRLYKTKVFLAIFIMPLLVTISVYMVQARKNKFRQDAVYAGRVMALRYAKKGLKLLKHQSKSDDPKIFYETMFKTLQDYIGNRLYISAAGITLDVVEQTIASKDVARDILRKLKNLFEACDQARFAFYSIGRYKMEDDLSQLEEVINYFERKRI